MECSFHPGTAAIGYCSGCGRTFCRACLVETPDGRFWCRPCTGGGYAVRQGAGGLAIASLSVSIASVMLCPLVSIAGLIMGLVELGRIRRGESPREGRGLALGGAIVGAVVMAYLILIILIIVAIVIASAAIEAR